MLENPIVTFIAGVFLGAGVYAFFVDKYVVPLLEEYAERLEQDKAQYNQSINATAKVEFTFDERSLITEDELEGEPLAFGPVHHPVCKEAKGHKSA